MSSFQSSAFSSVKWGKTSKTEVLTQTESESEYHSVMSNSLQPHGLYSPWTSPDQNTGVGNLSLLQQIFPTQESNWGFLHSRQILYQLSHKGSPRIMKWVTYPFSSRSSQPRNQTRVSCIVGGFFTNWAIRKHFSMYENMQESALTEIILLICISPIWGQYPVFSQPEFPHGSP